MSRLRAGSASLLALAMGAVAVAGAATSAAASSRPKPHKAIGAQSALRPVGPLYLQFQWRHGVALASYPQLWYSPLDLTPMPGDPNPSDGVWQPIGTPGTGGYAAFSTYAVPYPGAPQVAVAWINQAQARTQIYAGTSQPGGSWPYEGAISSANQASLVAAFEGGFIFNVSHGGWYEAGRTGPPLVTGAASIVEYNDGTVNIGAWGSEVGMTPQVYAVRQNLVMLVDNGQVLPVAQDNPLVTWGYSLGNLLYTWRSGLGVTANGNLVWVGGPGLSPQVLGEALVWARAVRGMQLDMNPLWVNFAAYDYSTTSGLSSSNLLSGMAYPPSHYLAGFWRDFLAVFLS